MTSLMVEEAGQPTDTRQKLLEVAMALISKHGCASTSLQMIADELGITKAAIYYHFRNRDELLVALMEPMLHQSLEVVEMAESQPTPRTQMEAMVRGYAQIVTKNRSLAAVVIFDSSVRRILQMQPEWGDVIERQLALLMQLESDASGFLKVTTLFSGLAGAATAAPLDIDDASLIEELSATGRRILGLRQPRQRGDTELNGNRSAARRPDPLPTRWKDVLTEV
jgi:AcrR family transcriptional regulator